MKQPFRPPISRTHCRNCRKEAQKTQAEWEYGLFLRLLRLFAAVPTFCNYLSNLQFQISNSQ